MKSTLKVLTGFKFASTTKLLLNLNFPSLEETTVTSSK